MTDIGTSRGTVEPEPTEIPGVVAVLWDGRRTVTWHKQEDLEMENDDGKFERDPDVKDVVILS